eukprot:985059_1
MSQLCKVAFISSLLSIISTVLMYFIDRDAQNIKVLKYYLIVEKEDVTQIDKQERLKVNDNKGRRHHLAKSMAQVFGIPYKNIEIGGTVMTKYGFIMRILHFIHESDLESIKEQQGLRGKKARQAFIDEVYRRFQTQINHSFREHFKFSGNFDVKCQHSLSIENRAVHEEQQEGNNDEETAADKEIVNTMYSCDVMLSLPFTWIRLSSLLYLHII